MSRRDDAGAAGKTASSSSGGKTAADVAGEARKKPSPAEEFVDALDAPQLAKLRELLSLPPAELATAIKAAVDEATKAAAELDKLPRRGSNHTHPARPGQPCPICGV
jgi:hypothetical protein